MSMAAERSPASQAAIAWMVELRSGEAGASERAAFERWLAPENFDRDGRQTKRLGET